MCFRLLFDQWRIKWCVTVLYTSELLGNIYTNGAKNCQLILSAQNLQKWIYKKIREVKSMLYISVKCSSNCYFVGVQNIALSVTMFVCLFGR